MDGNRCMANEKNANFFVIHAVNGDVHLEVLRMYAIVGF